MNLKFRAASKIVVEVDMSERTLVEQSGEVADAERILVERCANGWLVTVSVDDGDGTIEKVVFEYFDKSHDDQLPALCDVLKTVAKRIGPFTNTLGDRAEKEISIEIKAKQ